MLTTVILFASALLAAVFVAAWLLSPRFRQRIERPKHLFAKQVRQYDEGFRDADGESGAESGEAN